MIWIALVAVVFVLGGAWLVARTLPVRIAVAAAGLAAVAAYWMLGHPDMGDQPLDSRIADIQARETSNPETVTAEQFLALQQDLARKSPEDAEPYLRIGNLYYSNGRMEEALSAYRTALRRDPSYEPAADAISEIEFMATGEVDQATLSQLPRILRKAQQNPETLTSVQVLALINERLKVEPNDPDSFRMMGEIYASAGHLERAEAAFTRALELAPDKRAVIKAWADSRFKATQKIDAATSDLYNRAYKLDRDDYRIGYMAGLGLWLQDKKGEAEAIWADLERRVPQGGPERQMFAALRQMFGVDPPETAPNGQSPE